MALDNARYQRCRSVQELARELSIELLFLPSYSPNLNLIERLWKFVKHRTLNGKFHETFEDFREAIQNCLVDLSTTHKNALITRNFQLFDNQPFLTD